MSHSQAPKLIQALQNPALYPYPIAHFEIIETHISWLILTGRYAYKIKKALNLGFLNFSTLENRRHYCHEELRLNARLAPEIYLSVESIHGTETTPHFNSDAPIIEYAVKMRQFNPNQSFDQLLNRQQLTTIQIKQTAAIIAEFHQKISLSAPDATYGTPEAIMQPVRENFSQIQQITSIDHPELLQQLADWSEQHYQLHHPNFIQRKQADFIRECHGDLHLGNIAIIDDKITPFDGIEFNPALYWIDVISEIAFLVMDLLDRQQPGLAYQFLNAYLQQTGDYQSLKLLKFYLVYRAMVRAKVHAICSTQATSAEQKHQTIANYHSYLYLAQQFIQPKKPLLLLMHGLSGSGKSQLSEQIIEHFPAIRIRSDIERKRLFPQAAEKAQTTELYNAENSARTYQHLLKLTEDIISAGYSVIVDATFLKQQQRQAFIQLANRMTVSFRIIHSHADEQTLKNRIQQRARQHDNVSDADLKVLQQQLQQQQALTETERQHCISIDTTRENTLTPLWQWLDKNPC